MDVAAQLPPASSFLPLGYCYLWNPALLGLHLVSDSIIALACYSIPLGLVWFLGRRRDVSLRWMFWLFALFIAGCGTTHVMEIWTLWHPDFWVAGLVKGGTALASVGTAALMIHLLPQAVKMPSPEQLESANRELTTVSRELESLSYSVSHDLRAPLRAIIGFSQALMEDAGEALDEESRSHLRFVVQGALRMAHLIEGLLNLSRVSRAEMQMQTLGISELAEDIAAPLLSGTDRRVDLRVEPGIWATGDARLVPTLLQNLLDNAFKFTSHHATALVEVGTLERDGVLVAYVRDDGAGFDMAHSERLFGTFQRLHLETEFEGTGIGLATVLRIVRRHGGEVWAESRPEHGATFYFTLPDLRRDR